MGIERVYMPILTVIFWIIMIVVVVLGACIFVGGAMTGGIVVSEIFCAPRQDNNKASVEIGSEAKRVLENNGLRSCQARPITSRFINKKGVKVNGKRYVVFCDPNNRYLSDCCYQE